MRLPKKFINDIMWFNRIKHIMDFDGKNVYLNKKGNNLIQFDKKGVDGLSAFYSWDTNGQILKTKHPNILLKLLKIKGSVNLHIKMYAEDRAKGVLPKFEFDKIVSELDAPQWFVDAVEQQKYRYYG